MSVKIHDLEQRLKAASTVRGISSVFEGLAGMRIAQIKNQVLQSQLFFNALWQIYTQIRVDAGFEFGRRLKQTKVLDKELLIAVTAESNFSGDIDEKLLDLLLKDFNPDTQEIVVIGHHGVVQLAQRGIPFRTYFKMPQRDRNITVAPIIREVQQFRSTSVYYQTYVSLLVQDVRRISLKTAIEERGRQAARGTSLISEETYIFEPSVFAVVDHLEQTMLQVALSQVILDSKLAQYASRFLAMTRSHSRADEMISDLVQRAAHAKRSQKDERLKEMVNALRVAVQGVS